jgi:hypothetical protein
MKITPELALQILTALVALLAPWFTVRLALKRFYSEKWWERKFELYTQILRSLHAMKQCTDKEVLWFERGRTIPTEDREAINNAWNEAKQKIEEATTLGPFLLSHKAAHLLDTLKWDLEELQETSGDYQDQVWGEDRAIGRCLSGMREIARIDLQVAGSRGLLMRHFLLGTKTRMKRVTGVLPGLPWKGRPPGTKRSLEPDAALREGSGR